MHASAGMNIAPAFGGGGAQWWSTNLLDLNDVHAIDVEARSVPVSAKQNLRPTLIYVLASLRAYKHNFILLITCAVHLAIVSITRSNQRNF